MADENRDRSKKPDRDKAQSGSGGQRRDMPSGDEADEGKEDRFEADDVAQDRNLSGASTWLNLPDQPKGKEGAEDDEEPDGGDR